MVSDDELLDEIEAKIAEIQNQDYGHPIIQELLDLEAEIVLQRYYASQQNQITAGLHSNAKTLTGS